MPVFEFDVDGNPGFCTYVQFWLMVAPVAEVITNTQQTPKLKTNHLKELFEFVREMCSVFIILTRPRSFPVPSQSAFRTRRR